MSRPREPPRPDLSKTFWTPPFPCQETGVVRRAHPIPKWGDYNSNTGLYIWQIVRFWGRVTPAYASKIKRALAGMWYGVENDPRCNHCEKKDRFCTRVTTDVRGVTICARCLIRPESHCSFANGDKRNLSATNAVSGNGDENKAREGSDDESLARWHKRLKEAEEQRACQKPVKSHGRRRLIVQDDSDDDLPVKTVLDRRRANGRHEVNTAEAPSDGLQSPSLSSLFGTPSGTSPVSRPTTPPGNQALLLKDGSNSGPVDKGRGGHGSRGGYFGAQGPTEGPPINAPKEPRAMREVVSNRTSYPAGGKAQIEECLCALEAENNRYRAEQGLGRDRIVQLEEQISLLGQQQDHKLKQAILDIREMVNHAINQMITR
ncbi:hypothetical protein M436DRAFT_81844 [Aureobasidium namibiae CBS 147.97]|uniref:Uncharacterized protein n=1 Tax=Aureobasidium namibiae CBS 147.97 TaxID=1043004 RepID=A0A074WK55_9PEZI